MEYDRKIREMQVYLPFLEDKIDRLKQLKLKSTFPDEKRERRLHHFQAIYKALTNRDPTKRATVATLEKFETLIKKIQEQDFLESRQSRNDKDTLPKKDPNPFHNPDFHRPASSCSNASSSSGSYRPKKVFDDTPASPSPPNSPNHPQVDGTSSAPIIIPTERRKSRFARPDSPPPHEHNRYLFQPSPPPGPVPNILPITRVDVNQLEPQEWDSDEDNTANTKRPEIIVPKHESVVVPKKDEREDSRFLGRDNVVQSAKREFETKHPSDNIPTVQVNALGGSRRLKSVIEKTNLLNSDLNRFLTSHRPASPLMNVADESLRSPDPDLLRQSPAATHPPFSPTSRRENMGPPMSTPSLLLNAPPTTSKMPIAIDDIAEYLDDSERNQLRRQQQQQSRPQSRHSMASGMPNSSPVMMSPRSDPGPHISDSRVSSDPRCRPSSDPRTAVPSDPRTAHGGMAPNDPRLPRYADNYERHKRTTPQENQPQQSPMGGPPSDYQRHQFGPENPNMVPPQPMPGVPGPGPGPGPYGSHGQMGPMGYNYPMGPNQQSPQQQWNGPSQPPHPHMQQPGPPHMQQPGPPHMQQPMPPYGPMPPQQWQGGMYPDMPPSHPAMNGDGRMGGGYPNQMGPSNMYSRYHSNDYVGRNIPPLIPNNAGPYGMGPSSKYPSYSDMPYDHHHQQPQPPQQQQSQQRPSWGNDRYSNRPNTPFSRPSNLWGNKDGPPPRPPNRDPRVADRDPRTRSEPSQQQQTHRPTTPTVKGPPPGKEVHPNKLKQQQQTQDKDAGESVIREKVSKKRSEHHKPDLHKSKEKDKDKDKEKEKSKGKSGESMKSPLTDLYGAVDARKAIQGIGLQKFKIPKKRPSVETRSEPALAPEETCDDDDVVTSSSTSQESAAKQQTESTTSKKSNKSNEKEKAKEKASDKKEKSVESKKSSKASIEEDILKSLAKDNLSKEDVSSIVKALVKKLKKQQSKKTVIYSSDEDNEDEENEDEDESNSDERRPSSSTKKTMKKKKKQPARQIIESSSDESEVTNETPPEPASKKGKEKKPSGPKKSVENEEKELDEKKKKEKTNDKKKENDKNKGKDKGKEKVKEKEKEQIPEPPVPERKSPRKKGKEPEPEAEPEPESDKEEIPASESTNPVANDKDAVPEESTASTEVPVVKAKPKRRFRELDMLQEDLKSSWICDGAMKATGSRTCSQKNKQQEPTTDPNASSTTEEEGTATTSTSAKGTATVRSARAGSAKANTAQPLLKRKMKKPQPPKPKPKSKKAIAAAAAASAAAAAAAALATSSETSLLATSESEEDDLPLSRRSESTKAKSKKTRTKGGTTAPPPPLFDSSSNDSFNLDASAVEAATDISLHPDTSGNEKPLAKGKGLKKGVKQAADTAADSSSDESFVSNASSSLLLDTTSKQRDNNQELLDDVMAELATNPKYSVAKKKQVKKKKSNWQMGILSKKKKKKAAVSSATKADENVSLDSSTTTELDTSSNKDHETGANNKASTLERSESLDQLENEEESNWRADPNATDDNEDLTSRVDAEALIGYTLAGNEKYQCLLCTFYRKNIVHHYKMQHPRKEVLISRLAVSEANIAIEQAKKLDFEHNESPPIDKEIGKYSCRFCSFTTKGVDSCARESFYEHCTNHTGEYRFACQNCNYEAVAKGSIRTHYYKECRKYSNSKNLNEAIVEDPLPPDDRIYGYLCSKCNFVQLKKSNVEKHVKTWHKEGEIKIIKIDMSLNIKKEEDTFKADANHANSIPHKVELKDEGESANGTTAIADGTDVKDVKDGIVTNDETVPDEDEVHVTLEVTEHRPDEKPEKKEKNNLSAFLCATEIGTKEAEIQNERKKKMQEIAENIGIKVDKEDGQKRISIIDKLKDKMVMPVDDEPERAPTPEDKLVIDASESPEETEEAVDPLHIPEQNVESQVPEEKSAIPETIKIKADPDAVEKEDKASAKMKDPLAYVDEPAKPMDSDGEEHSDGEPSVAPVQYDSDTSGEQSDHEMSTDVNSILQNTKEIGSPSKGHMMTTIQRLAAQLQNTKPLETPPPPPTISTAETIVGDIPMPIIIKTEKISPRKGDDDMAILSPTKIKKEVKKEPESSPQKKVKEEPKQSSPKTFIRIRRISGDKLSKGGDQEISNNENDQSITSMATIEPIDSNTNDKDTGFLKIANVVSLASKDGDNQIVSNMRKAVETSPQKIKGLSLLKKPNSYILKRLDTAGAVVTQSGETVKLIPLTLPPTSRTMSKSDNYISIGGQPAVAIKIDSKGVAVPLSMTTANTANTNLANSNHPIKLFSITAPEQVSVAIKLKSANVYEKMLKDEKLIHMFKCMGRDCSFTTSSESAFCKHIRIHEEDLSNKVNNDPKDYFKCAYCYIDCNNYEFLMQHLKTMHTFCRFCCKYCFYRAFASSYVEIHQKTYHPTHPYKILVVGEELVHSPPPPKRLNRKQIVKPYVCIHECNKYFFIPEAFVLHLNMHHTNIVSGFKCHICQGVVPSVDNLIEHYKTHGFFKYHCMYCTHGSASIKELHNHLSVTHYNQPPHVLERCLPREISKNLGAIDQLRVRDVDQLFKQRKYFAEDDLGKVAIPSLIRTTATPVTLAQNAPIVTTKIFPSKVNSGTSGGTLVPLGNLDGGLSNIRIVDARSLNTNASTSLLNLGKNIQVTVTESAKVNSGGNTHTMEDDNNEFISTSFFDRAHLLTSNKKKADAKSNDTTNAVADYDSDCEIIEDYTSIAKDCTKDDEIPIKEEATDANSVTSDVEGNSNTPSASNSAPGTPKATPSESPNPTGRFLTLDDVKGTGFTGHDLYRCGVETCKYSTETAEELRQHMQQCNPTDEESITDAALYCVHCGPSSKRYGKPSFFLDHIKTHGVKRFSCGICNARFAVQSQAQSHLRAKHKYVSSKILPADPMNPAPDGLFIVHPMTSAEKLKSKKLKTPEKDSSKLTEMEKTTYGPNEIGSLPLQAIFNRPVQCAVCPYNNKVRTNIVRHLQAHLNDETVPDSSPVNPVPCLDKKERMFDKMVNLASSSHENGRMGGGGSCSAKKEEKDEDEASLPKYVPENKRYVCGVPECNYLTVEEAMLRHHLKALHSDEVYFRCPHCLPPSDPSQNIPLDKMGVHLKMHDNRLYKCSHCIYHHHHRHLVERHLTDKHPEKRQFVKVIRELQLEEDKQATGETTDETDQPDPDGNTWKCNLCDFKCMLKAAMQNHAATAHDERCQYKCNSCGFKAISKLTLEQHLATKHLTEPGVDYTTVYQRIKVLKKPDPSEALPTQDEPFDTTPLWRRDMPRIRHIRGILLEEEEENNKATKRKATAESDSSSKPAKIKTSGKSASLDDCKSPEPKKARTSLDVSELRQPDGSYGPFGKPIGEQYVCTICNQFKSKYKHDFRDHLYRDLKYMRWFCSSCGYKSVNRGALVKHFSSRHSLENLECRVSSPNAEIEEWVASVIKTQTDIMKSTKVEATALAEEEEEVDETDNDDLVIDMKEEDENEISDEEEGLSELLPAPLNCKHCNAIFTKWRGFKRHVQLKHLRRLRFLCPYCDRSSNSESVMLQHVRKNHGGLPERVVTNPNPHQGELNAEFWEREYSLVVPKYTKKRKRQEVLDENMGTPKSEPEFACEKCDFIAMTIGGLKSHMKTHETKIKQKCSYCTFSSFNSSEMRQHWDVNHAHLEFKVEEAFVTSSMMEPSGARTTKKTKLDDDKKATVYYCYYCDMGSTSLDHIRSHWRMMHKDDDKSTIFKYREHSEPKVKCAYCGEPGTKSIIANHIWQKHGSDKQVLLVEQDEDGWMCKWCVLTFDDDSSRCKEGFMTTKEEIEQHQKQYHSHLRWNYQLVHRSFSCKQCSFDTPSLEVMQKHAKSHVNVYKCKYCSEMFRTFTSVRNHFKLAHPDREPETRTITSDDLSKEIDNVIYESSCFTELQLSPTKITPMTPVRTPPTSPRLAKKSTTKQSLTPVKPQPGKMKAVARKSTNPLPRYPKGLVFETEVSPVEEERPKYMSYYGKSVDPIDLSSVTTEMAVAGRLKMKVKCDKLAEYFQININPSLRIVDFRKSGRNARR